MRLGTCGGCAGQKRLRDYGTIPIHYVGIPVSRRAVRTVGAGRVRRRCPGSGKQPRRVNGDRPDQPGAPPRPGTASSADADRRTSAKEHP